MIKDLRQTYEYLVREQKNLLWKDKMEIKRGLEYLLEVGGMGPKKEKAVRAVLGLVNAMVGGGMIQE